MDGLSSSRTSAALAALLAIVTLALGLRLAGITYGLPDIYNEDEIAIMDRALAFGNGDLNPHNFLYPTFFFYVLFAWEGALFVAGRMAGLYHSLGDFQREFFVDPSRLYLAGRVLSAMCGAVTVAATHQLGTRLFDRQTGLGAALLLAVAPFAVRDAHYVKHDVPVTLLIVLTLCAVARLLVDDEARDRPGAWIRAGALAGLATSTHYYAIFVTLPIAVVASVSRPLEAGRSVRRLVSAAVAAIAVFAATSPFVLLEPGTALRDIVANRRLVVDSAVGGGAFASLPRYLGMLANDAMGWPSIAAGSSGAVLALVVDWRRAAVLLAFALPFLLFISNTMAATRYLNPLLPVIAVLAALALTRAVDALGGTRRLNPSAAVVVLLLTAVPGFLASLRGVRFFRMDDTRTLARAFIEAEIPAESSILIEPYSVPLRQSAGGLVESLRENLGSEARASIKFRKQLEFADERHPSFRTIWLGDFSPEARAAHLDPDKIYISPGAIDRAGINPLRARGVQYVVLKRGDGRERIPRSLVDALERDAVRLAEFSPYRADAGSRALAPPFIHNSDARIDVALERPGPILDVYRLIP